MDDEIVSTSEALIKLAENMEKLANSIEAADVVEKTASENSMDYGTLAGTSQATADPLTAFCLG